MEVTDFLPKYPNVDKTEHDILNPYEDGFYEAIFHKKEFYDNRLTRSEQFPRERGVLMKHQQTISRYLSSNTPYDRLLLVHAMGSGKSCSAVGAIEQVKSENSTIKGALILVKGPGIINNWRREIVEKCTAGQYIPEGYNRLVGNKKTIRVRKKLKYYNMNTFAVFAKKLKKLTDRDIKEKYSNMFIVVDEVHNLRIMTEKDKETRDYKQYERLFDLVENSKILLLSGTPMKDGPEEIASVMNLLLPKNKKLPVGQNFLDQYMNKKGNVYEVKPERVVELKHLFKSYISFLREAQSTVEKKYLGEKNFGKLKHLVVLPLNMKKSQALAYDQAVEKDQGKGTGVYSNSREASLFVYPDGSFGSNGFKKYIEVVETKVFVIDGKEKTVSSYKMRPELKEAIKGRDNKETLHNLKKYSITYAKVIQKIFNTNGNCFVYSSIVKGSGCILFSLILELFGFSKANGTESEKKLRYGILTNITTSPAKLRAINEQFNRVDNMRGDIVKVIIGSKVVSEGFSFKNVLLEAIVTPYWNYSETSQALARGIRLGSHNDLIKSGDKPVVEIMQTVAVPKKKKNAIDLMMYEISEDKDVSIKSIIRLIMETSFDCALNYFRNRNFTDKDGSPDCEYTTCDYKCDGMDMAEIHNGLPEQQLDYSTYQLYYANPKTPLIRKKIEQLFRDNIYIDLDSIVNNLKGEFNEDEIKNALYTIQEETESEEFNYTTFLKIYSRTPVKKIMNEIDILFRSHFKLDLETILQQFPNYTTFEVLTALRTMINSSTVIINRYGFSSYLREENNTFFLVSSLDSQVNFFTGYYTRYPNIDTKPNFDLIMSQIYSSSLPKIVKNICSTETDKQFIKMMKTLPKQVQEMFIEASLIAKDRKIKKNKDMRKKVLKFFEGYIKKIDNTWVSTFLRDSRLKDGDEVLRCREVGEQADWEDCDKRYDQLLVQHLQKQKQELRENNPFGIIGKYNPQTKDFCIVDLEKEKSTQKGTKKGESIDYRRTHSGKVCSAGGWKLTQLMELAIKRVKIKPPNNFRDGDSKQRMIDRIKKEPKLMSIMTEQELQTADRDELRRALYWGTTSKDGGNRGIKEICSALQKALDQAGLLEIDNQCGVQGKKKATQAKGVTKRVFRIERYIPAKMSDKMKEHLKEISKQMDECFGEKKYKVPMNNDIWILIFSRKKLVGFFTVKDQILSNVCIAKNYRRQGIPIDAMGQALSFYTDQPRSFRIVISNRDKNIKKLTRMYKSFGFEVERVDNKSTYMVIKEA